MSEARLRSRLMADKNDHCVHISLSCVRGHTLFFQVWICNGAFIFTSRS